MMKAQKMEYVKKLKGELSHYKTVGIMPIDSIPDRLVQKVRSQLKPDSKLVVARKSLILRVLDGESGLGGLENQISSNFALVLTNKDPAELNRIVTSNRIKLGAKPNQISPEDICIESGETAIAPGQAVTDLKTAGIDVQIQKGKVVISKSKVLVAKGAKITTAVSKALKMLDILPFEASTKLNAVVHDGLLFTSKALAIDERFVTEEVARSFSEANALALSAGIVTRYNVDSFIRRAYLSALGVGLEAKIYEPEVTERLIANAVLQALGLQALVKAEEPKEEAKPKEPKAGEPKADQK